VWTLVKEVNLTSFCFQASTFTSFHSLNFCEGWIPVYPVGYQRTGGGWPACQALQQSPPEKERKVTNALRAFLVRDSQLSFRSVCSWRKRPRPTRSIPICSKVERHSWNVVSSHRSWSQRFGPRLRKPQPVGLPLRGSMTLSASSVAPAPLYCHCRRRACSAALHRTHGAPPLLQHLRLRRRLQRRRACGARHWLKVAALLLLNSARPVENFRNKNLN